MCLTGSKCDSCEPFPNLDRGTLKMITITNFHNIIPGLQAVLSACLVLEAISVEDQGSFESVQFRHDTLRSISFFYTNGGGMWLEMPCLDYVKLGKTQLDITKIRSFAPKVTVHFTRGMHTRYVIESPGGNIWRPDLDRL